VHAILGPARVRLDDGWKAADLEKLAEAHAESRHADEVARAGASAPVHQEAESFHKEAARRLARAQANRELMEILVDLAGPQNTKDYARDESGQWRSIARGDLDKEYAAAFRHWGLDVDGAAEAEVVARLAAEPEPVVQELLVALDTWTSWRLRNRPEADWRRLFRVADELDRSNRGRRFRGLLLAGFAPRAEVVAGMVGARSPWQALSLWELQQGVAWGRLQELRREIDPKTEPVLTVALLARMFIAAKDLASAEEVLSHASTARPKDVLFLHQLGDLLAEQGPSRLEEAIGYYRAARSLRPGSGVSLSAALVDAGRPSQAEAVMQALLSQRPGHPNYLVHLGVALLAQRRFGDAEATYRQVIDHDPDYAEAHSNLGVALNDQGRPKEAEKAFRTAIKLKPDLVEAHSNLGMALSRQGRLKEAEKAYRDAIKLKPDLVEAHYNLGIVLGCQGRLKEAEQAYRNAIKLKPDLAEARNNLGVVLNDQGRPKEAEQTYHIAIKLKPNFAEAHNNLGVVLNDQGRLREAEQAYRDAIKFKSDYAKAHNNLGNTLLGQGRPKEAEQACRDAIKFKPDYAEAHNNLGTALMGQGRPKEAEQACRDAIKFKPDYAEAHNNLGVALNGQGRPKEAEQAYRDTIKFKADFAKGHNNLGNTLLGQGRPKEAEQAYRDAIKLKPDYAEAHNNLGNALMGQSKYKEAEQACRDAIRLKPDYAAAHNNLAVALLRQGRYKEAEQACRDTIGLKPDYAEAHNNLGIALRCQGMFEEALKSFHRCIALFPSGSRGRQVAQQLIAETERLVELDARLSEVLAGNGEPASAAERLKLKELCYVKTLYASAARFCRDAFVAEPKLAENVAGSARYYAACAAALAGCGQGKDAAETDDAERARWRRQALEWLRLDLAWWSKTLEDDKAMSRALVRSKLQYWRNDDAFAGVRGDDALARIPAEERKEWERFWAEVDALLRRTSEPD
jgi:tetratricopeptide (TPR) repeat protein